MTEYGCPSACHCCIFTRRGWGQKNLVNKSGDTHTLSDVRFDDFTIEERQQLDFGIFKGLTGLFMSQGRFQAAT